jgi:hypothetical protein
MSSNLGKWDCLEHEYRTTGIYLFTHILYRIRIYNTITMCIVKHTMFYVYTSLLNNIYYVLIQPMYTLHVDFFHLKYCIMMCANVMCRGMGEYNTYHSPSYIYKMRGGRARRIHTCILTVNRWNANM